MSIRVMIVEDESLAREELVYLLQQEGDVFLCPDAKSGEELLVLYEKYRPDILFLDIHMPGLSGLEVARRLQADYKGAVPLMVFTTAYDQHAVEAFELEAVDYLLKPYDENRFKKAMERVRKQLIQRSLTGNQPLLERKMGPAADQHLSLKSAKLLLENGEKVAVLSPETICYAARAERVLEVHTEHETIRTRMTLQELEKRLTGYPFFRSHRSYLVNLEFIQEITPWFNGAYNLILKDGKRSKIPVSRSAAKRLFELLRY